MDHWFDTLTRNLSRQPHSRRSMIAWAGRLGLAVVGAGLLGPPRTVASAAPASATTSCAVTDSYGVLTAVATTISDDPPAPLTLRHTFLAEVGSGIVSSSLVVTPGTGAAVAPDDVVLRMTSVWSPGQRASATATLGRRFTGTNAQSSGFYTDGQTIEGRVNGQAIPPAPANRRIGTTGQPTPDSHPGGRPSPDAIAIQGAVTALLGQATAQIGTCSPDSASSPEVATCTRCQLTCRHAFEQCALPIVQRALASGVTAPSDFLAVANATCSPALQQCLGTCKTSGACCPSFCNGDAACCQSAWGCCPPSSHSRRQWSRAWPTCPRCGTPPWTTGSTAIAPTPSQTCSPRPPVSVTTRRGGGDTLEVTVTISRPPVAAPNNTLARIEIGEARNADVVINGQSRPAGGVSVPVPPGLQSTTFTIRRQAPGQPTTVPLTVIDGCGPWKTLVGAGAWAF